ncbi:LCP family protein [Cohnella suwonensis]|uniref:LCP family protein n=1 Tax=Cohnella suwonensis TaxID=696072 RepID=A0ABW0M2Y1_9BACL
MDQLPNPPSDGNLSPEQPVSPLATPEGTTATRISRQPRRKNVRRILLYSALGLVLVLGSVAGYYAYSFYSFANKIYDDPRDRAQPSPSATSNGNAPSVIPVAQPPEWVGDERINILLLGGDSRGVNSSSLPRSDSMALVSIDPVAKTAKMFSLLRDTYVVIPGHGQNRLNAAITLGGKLDGPLLAMDTVHFMTGLPVHFYVYTDFEGFISLIDELGGIDFEVDKSMKHTDNADDPRYNIKLEKGLQHLDGVTALQYVRFRSDAMSDFARSERQRQFLFAIADKLQSTTSLLKLPQVLDGIAPYIKTNIPPGDLLKLARLGMKLDTSQLHGVQIPQNGAFKNALVESMDVLVPDVEKIQSYIQEQLQPPTATNPM